MKQVFWRRGAGHHEDRRSQGSSSQGGAGNVGWCEVSRKYWTDWANGEEGTLRQRSRCHLAQQGSSRQKKASVSEVQRQEGTASCLWWQRSAGLRLSESASQGKDLVFTPRKVMSFQQSLNMNRFEFKWRGRMKRKSKNNCQMINNWMKMNKSKKCLL